MSTSAPAVVPSAAAPEVPLDSAEYDHPHLECDVVMKGGITSGVVYPLAVCELAKTYRFRCIGGTSAGAIAAAATAAAELGRRNGGKDRRDGRDANHGFRELARLPAWLGASEEGADRSHLFALFQPDRRTDALFDVATARLRGRGTVGRMISRFPAAAVLGSLVGLGIAWVGTREWPALAGVILVLLGLGIAGLGIMGAPAMLLARRARREIPANGFGLCSGNGPDIDDPTGMPPALTPWLAHLLNDLAGKRREGGPVTFGDLWNLQGQPVATGQRPRRDIDLQLMTTNLTHGRPYQFPFESRIFSYDPVELARYFPAWVMAPMNAAATRIKQAKALERAQRKERRAAEAAAKGQPLEPACRGTKPNRPLDPRLVEQAQAQWDRMLPFPAPEDVPIVVGARLSLSFPILFSAVPLYAVDYSRVLYDDERSPELCWFSDGGICSNFPVHFFDSVLPARPTFGINLLPFPDDRVPDRVNQLNNSFFPLDNSDAIGEWFTRLPTAGWTSLAGFVGLIVTTMQNWMDNTQLRVPGYRDRVAHVLLDEQNEGGLNLNMPPRTIQELGARGQLAARELARRFDPVNVPTNTPLTWDNHRWVRFRSSMQLLEGLLRDIGKQYRASVSGGRTYEELVQRTKGQHPSSYRWPNQPTRDAAVDALRQLTDLDLLKSPERVFVEDAPKPTPELRIRPSL